MKKLFTFTLISISCLCIGTTGQCESIVTYSDDYISFEYDEDIFCKLSLMNYHNELTYILSTQNIKSDPEDHASIQIRSIKDYEEENNLDAGTWKSNYFSEMSSDDVSWELVNDGDMPELKITRHDNGKSGLEKLIGYNSDIFVVAQYIVSDINSESAKACQTIYDSASVIDGFESIEWTPTEELSYDTLYQNVILSDQGLTYAKAALDVLTEYLSFQTSADDAKEQITDIAERNESYAESSDYVYDSELSNILYSTGSDIESNNDADIAETIEEIKALAKIE